MKTWWHIRKRTRSGSRRIACSPERWPIGIAMTWYWPDLAIGFRLDRGVGLGYLKLRIATRWRWSKWAVDIGPLAIHGWYGGGCE